MSTVVAEPPIARRLWLRLETLHAVTYFAPESRQAAADAGLRGFWMGYFGFRAAPLGQCTAAVVMATFANFAPSMVRRSIPDAWRFADPASLVVARRDAARSALVARSTSIADAASPASELLARAVAAADPIGRPLFAANAALDLPDEPVCRLWQLATSLREHRGDAHVAALAAAGVDGCEAHLLHAADFGTSHDVLRPNRGWTDDEWAAAEDRLDRRGLVRAGVLTDDGRALRDHVEDETDRLAASPYDVALDPSEQARLLDLLDAPASEVAASETIPFPNPMGLPRVS